MEPGIARPLDFFMVEGGVIAGRVLDSEGEPVPRITVVPYQEYYRSGKLEWVDSKSAGQIAGGTTDDRGEFRIFNVPPGRYWLGVTPVETGVFPVRTFYPGTNDPAAAVAVLVTGGAEITELRIPMPPAPPTYAISGAVLNPASDILPNPATGVIERSPTEFNVRLLDAWISSEHRIRVQSGPAGEFTIGNLPPGSYELTPVFSRSSAGYGFGMTAIVHVQDEDVSNVVFSPIPEVSLEVHAALEGNADIDWSSIGFGLITPADAARNTRHYNNCCRRFDGDGSLRATVPGGRYRAVLTWLPETAYVSDVRLGGRSVFDAGADLTGLREARLEVVVGTNSGSIQGLVRKLDRDPGGYSAVLLVPEPARRSNDALFKLVTADENGRFALRGILPGSYTLLALRTIPFGEPWLNADFLRRYEGRGQSVTIDPGAVLSAEFEWIED